METTLQRMITTYGVLRRVFGLYIFPLIPAFLFANLRIVTFIAMSLDGLFFPSLRKKEVKRPIILVGNPRTGTTFLQRWLSDNQIGSGSQLFRMLYPSLLLQTIIKPVLPILELVSPARFHNEAAHKTSLGSVETDDVAMLFRYFDGFFLYGFFLAFDEEDRKGDVDPKVRNTNRRDFPWLRQVWRRQMVAQGSDRIVGKLFSLAPRLPDFLEEFPDARILYMARDPIAIIPSGMSLVTGVLDAAFGFWKLDQALRDRYLERLYSAFVMLLQRFHDDWESGAINRDNVYVVRYDRMMKDFDTLMLELLDFVGHEPDEAMKEELVERARKQAAYVSKHKYNLEKFNLDADRIREDCKFFYDTFLPPMPELDEIAAKKIAQAS